MHSCIHLFLGNQEPTCWGHLNVRVLLTLGYLFLSCNRFHSKALQSHAEASSSEEALSMRAFLLEAPQHGFSGARPSDYKPHVPRVPGSDVAEMLRRTGSYTVLLFWETQQSPETWMVNRNPGLQQEVYPEYRREGVPPSKWDLLYRQEDKVSSF